MLVGGARQLIEAATREFARHGYAGTSLADVAQAAGITKPLVYSYFGRKDDVFVACLARASAKLGVSGRTALVARAMQLGALPPPPG